jgi:hypothetical protein
MFISQLQMIQHHLRFAITPNSGHFSGMPLVPLMEAISILHLLHLRGHSFETGKALCLKIAYLAATLGCSLFILLQDGKDLPQMPMFMKMLEIMILRSQLASITLQMLVIHFVPNSWYLIEMC